MQAATLVSRCPAPKTWNDSAQSRVFIYVTPSPARGTRPQLTETQAIQRSQSGDRHAFRHLVDQYQDDLFRAATLMTGSQTQAEQQVRDALRLAWRGIHTFNLACPIQPWLLRILLRQGASHRLASSKSTVPASNQDRPPEISPPVQPDEAGREHQSIRQALAALEPNHRHVLVLRYFAHLKGPQLALALDVPEHAAESIRRQALGQLRELFKAGAAQSPKTTVPGEFSDRALAKSLSKYFTAASSSLRAPPDLWDALASPTGNRSRLARLRRKLQATARRYGIPVAAASRNSHKRSQRRSS